MEHYDNHDDFDEVDDEEKSSLSEELVCLESSNLAYRLPLSLKQYKDVDYFSNWKLNSKPLINDFSIPSLFIVIGSETNRISCEAYHLAHLTQGFRISFPSTPWTSKLDSSCFISIVLSEIQRQYCNL